MSETGTISVGTIIGDRYVIESLVGMGGMATVYAARDQRYNRRVAIKVLSTQISFAMNPERFAREISIIATLQHPNVLPLFDSGEWEGAPYYVMPLVEGESLHARLSRQPRLTDAEVVVVLRQVAAALDYCHAHGIVHRDIKPDNILLTGTAAVIADFGIARPDGATATRLTATGVIVGTPQYMSPEQSSSETVPPASDQYALACVAFEMLAGRPPFGGNTPQAVVMSHWRDAVPSIADARPDLSPGVTAVFMRALAKLPDARFATCTEFVMNLEEALVRRGKGAPAASARPARQRWLVGAALVIAVIVGALVFRLLPDNRSTGAGADANILAVLPMTHTGDSSDAFLAEGLTAEIRNRVASIRTLRTVTTASSAQYSLANLGSVRRDLHARWVLSGIVSTERSPSSPAQVRVQSQLLDMSVKPERAVWTSSLIETLTPGELFSVQAKIAEGVAKAVSAELVPEERAAIDAGVSRNPEAYALYLRALPLAKMDFEASPAEAAIQLLDKATTIDSSFALAWAKLMQLRVFHYYFFTRSPDELPAMRHAAERAVATGPELAETRIGLALVASLADHDDHRARQLMEAARIAEPSNPQVLMTLARIARNEGRWTDAVSAFADAVRIDPRSKIVAIELGATYLVLRDYDKAEAELKRCVDLDTSWWACRAQAFAIPALWHGDTTAMQQRMDTLVSKFGLGTVMADRLTARGDGFWELPMLPAVQSRLPTFPFTRTGEVDSVAYYLALGDYLATHGKEPAARDAAQRALAVVDVRLKSAPELPELHGFRARALARLGHRDEAVREGTKATELMPVSKDALRGPGYERPLLEVHLILHDTTDAIEVLRRQLSVPGDISSELVRVDPRFTFLHGLPQYEALLKRTP